VLICHYLMLLLMSKRGWLEKLQSREKRLRTFFEYALATLAFPSYV